MSRACTVGILIVALGGCVTTMPPPKSGPIPDGAIRLPRKWTTFIRFYGTGKLPKLTSPIEYELCLDLESAKLVSVRAPGSAQQSDEQLANVLRGWKWIVKSSRSLSSGTKCWRERFSPGDTGVVMEMAMPLRLLQLPADSLELFEVPRNASPLETVSAFAIVEGNDTRFAFLEPRLQIAGTPGQIFVGDPPREGVHTTPIDPPVPHSEPKPEFGDSSIQYEIVRVCVDRDGQIASLTPDVPIHGLNGSIIGAMKTWHFPPPSAPFCFYNYWTSWNSTR